MSANSRSLSLHRLHSHQSPLTPDHTHLNSDHLVPAASNQATFKNMLHSVTHRPVYRSLPRTVRDSCALLTCVYFPLDLPTIPNIDLPCSWTPNHQRSCNKLLYQ